MAEEYDNQSTYLYAFNNPVRFTDYLGMGAQDEVDQDKDKDKKKKDEEAKKKEEEKKKEAEKNAEEAKKKEKKKEEFKFELSEEDEEYMIQMIMGSSGGLLVKVGKGIIAEINIYRAIKLALKDPNKIGHLFKEKHLFTSLIKKLGGEENTVKEVMKAANSSGKLPKSGIYKVAVKVCDQTVVVSGNVINGVPRIGTMYIPK